MRRKNSIKKPIIIFSIFILITVILIISSAKDRGNVSFFDNTVAFVVNPIAKVIGGAGHGIGSFFEYFHSKKALIQTVGELTTKNNLLDQKVSSLISLEAENDRLRKMLDLRDKYPKFDTITASVISKDGGNYCRFITVDKGVESGLTPNQAVISGDGLVGLIFETGNGWSKIQTILDPSTSAGCRITRTGDISVTEGDPALFNSGLLKMLYISKQFTILEGDILETSGLGEIYPRGIPIGRIKEIKLSENSSSQYATIMPVVDFSNIYEVLIITNKDG